MGRAALAMTGPERLSGGSSDPPAERALSAVNEPPTHAPRPSQQEEREVFLHLSIPQIFSIHSHHINPQLESATATRAIAIRRAEFAMPAQGIGPAEFTPQ